MTPARDRIRIVRFGVQHAYIKTLLYFVESEAARKPFKTFSFSRHTIPEVTSSLISSIGLLIYEACALLFLAEACQHFIGLHDFTGNMSTSCYWTEPFPIYSAITLGLMVTSWMRSCSRRQPLSPYCEIPRRILK